MKIRFNQVLPEAHGDRTMDLKGEVTPYGVLWGRILIPWTNIVSVTFDSDDEAASCSAAGTQAATRRRPPA